MDNTGKQAFGPLLNNGFKVHDWHYCIPSYKEPLGEWDACPCCGLAPKVWVFDNGRFTACGCWNSKYSHFSIGAESIMRVLTRTGGFTEYSDDDHRINWNQWCKTGEMK